MTCLKENEVRACRLGRQKQLSVKNQNCSFMRFLIRWVLTHGLWADVLYLKHLGPKFLSEKLGVLMEWKLLRKVCAPNARLSYCFEGNETLLGFNKTLGFIKPSLTQSRALGVSRHFGVKAWPGYVSSSCVSWRPLSLSLLTLPWTLPLRAPGLVLSISCGRHGEITSRGQSNMLLNLLVPALGSGARSRLWRLSFRWSRESWPWAWGVYEHLLTPKPWGPVSLQSLYLCGFLCLSFSIPLLPFLPSSLSPSFFFLPKFKNFQKKKKKCFLYLHSELEC